MQGIDEFTDFFPENVSDIFWLIGHAGTALWASCPPWHGVLYPLEIKTHFKSPEDRNTQIRGQYNGWDREERTEEKYLSGL